MTKNNPQPKPITLRECEFDGVSYVSPTWDQMGEHTFRLGRQIIDSEQKFDRVVALAKGGWTWARTLVDYIGVDEISSVRIKSYQGINESFAPQITSPLTDPINGESILLFDEVIDSGETIIRASEYIKMMGAKNLKIASLCYKPRSSVKPDFYAFKTEGWVVFPHEIREFIEACAHKWKLNKVSNREIEERFEKIGIPEDQVKFFLDRLSG